mgnify:CR=1 FL=1|tara:strand:+ start:16063 stop:16413 length:351 start_codon:yes stop_codon:yes gene_type:complete
MGLIISTDTRAIGAKAVVETTLTSSDTFTYNRVWGQLLILRNPTAGALTPVIDGDESTTAKAPGAPSFDVSSGYSVGSIAAGAVVSIDLDSISAYLSGTIAVTGGTGLIASLLRTA